MSDYGKSILPQAFLKYQGKTALVVGAARSGLAVAELLLCLGAKVILNDAKPAGDFGALPTALQNSRCQTRFGEPAEPLLAQADFLVISPGIPVEAPFVVKAMERGLPVLGEMAFAASCVSQDILAVSGTNGKTTTVSLLGEIIGQAGRVAHVAGNIGYPVSAAVLHAKPEDVLVIEVSSFQLETVGEFKPRVAALLNITPDHLDRHHSMETYAAMKLRLFDNMGAQETAVLNYDDPLVAAMAPQIKANIVWFSRSGKAPSGAMLKDGIICWASETGEIHPLCAASDLRIPGEHNIENALAAVAAVVSMGVSPQVIAYGLKVFRGVEHRIEFVDEIDGVRWLNDSKGTNPDSTVKAVESMKAPTVLIAGGYDKQVPFESLASAVAGSGMISAVVLIGQTADKINAALDHAGYPSVFRAASLEEAVQSAVYLAQKGGNVLFSPACASFDMFHDYEQRGRVFKHLVEQLKAKDA